MEEDKLEVDIALLGGIGDGLPAIEGSFAELCRVIFYPRRIFIIPMVSPDSCPVDSVGFHAFEGLGEIGDVIGSPGEVETDWPVACAVIESKLMIAGFTNESFGNCFAEGEVNLGVCWFAVVGDDAEEFAFFGGGEIDMPFSFCEVCESGNGLSGWSFERNADVV